MAKLNSYVLAMHVPENMCKALAVASAETCISVASPVQSVAVQFVVCWFTNYRVLLNIVPGMRVQTIDA